MTDRPENNADDIGYECIKHQIRLDAGWAKCMDPELYCKFRPSCMIHFLEKENARARAKRMR
ncbi:MAG: hypothetical protein C4519_04020 [Desulfobacteraceae bacterium]|nr:MAG: hypothetical protein C4519_04020 [Desulfobacteraceae bacterium]